MLKIIIGFFLGIFFCGVAGIILLMMIPYENPDLTPKRLLKKPIDEDKVFSLVNKLRVQSNLPELKQNWELCGYADKRSKEVQSDWSHDGFKKDWPELRKELNYYNLGENLADNGFNSEEDMVNAWVNSASHSANIAGDYTDSCIQCNNNYCAQIFASF